MEWETDTYKFHSGGRVSERAGPQFNWVEMRHTWWKVVNSEVHSLDVDRPHATFRLSDDFQEMYQAELSKLIVAG